MFSGLDWKTNHKKIKLVFIEKSPTRAATKIKNLLMWEKTEWNYFPWKKKTIFFKQLRKLIKGFCLIFPPSLSFSFSMYRVLPLSLKESKSVLNKISRNGIHFELLSSDIHTETASLSHATYYTNTKNVKGKLENEGF